MQEIHILIDKEEMIKLLSDEYSIGMIYSDATCLGSGEETRIYKDRLGDKEVVIISQPLED